VVKVKAGAPSDHTLVKAVCNKSTQTFVKNNPTNSRPCIGKPFAEQVCYLSQYEPLACGRCEEIAYLHGNIRSSAVPFKAIFEFNGDKITNCESEGESGASYECTL
jgi:hypothetical protein